MSRVKNRRRAVSGAHSTAARGQMMATAAVFMMTLLGAAALSVDVGRWYNGHQGLQAAVDASALAGASQLPSGWSTAQTAAANEYANNGSSTDTVVYLGSGLLTAGDSITVTASRVVVSQFAELFGRSTVTVTASARATVESYTSVVSHNSVMPWGAMRGSYVPGQAYSMYTDNSSSSNGALSLPYDSGTACPVPAGANPYEEEIGGTLNACPITIGEVIPIKPGNNAGPTRHGIDQRITSWESVSQVVQFGAGGFATIIDPTSPVLVPIVEDPSGATNWQNGSGQVRVVGFAWFVLTGPPGYTDNGKTVTGVFVNAQLTDPLDATGAYSPQTGTLTAVELTG